MKERIWNRLEMLEARVRRGISAPMVCGINPDGTVEWNGQTFPNRESFLFEAEKVLGDSWEMPMIEIHKAAKPTEH